MHKLKLINRLALLVILAMATACSVIGNQAVTSFTPIDGKVLEPSAVESIPLKTTAGDCNGQFTSVLLEHISTPSTEQVHQFESNGTGVAINDLNNDGLLEIVLANLDGPSTILWNQGDFRFEKQELPEKYTRAVNIVDVDGDGWNDVVFTHISVEPSLWHNSGVLNSNGRPELTHSALKGVNQLAHSMAWADLNGDGQLDLVTGSYDAELNLQPGGAFLFNGGAGVFVYTQKDGAFQAQRLSKTSQALAIALVDVNDDNQPDILVGNDFDIPDMGWLNSSDGWQSTIPFGRSSQHTMSYDWGDLENNGTIEFFATDMNPYQVDLDELAQWVPMMKAMPHRLSNLDVQRAQNVLQVKDQQGKYNEESGTRGVIAAGWGWSGKFGDLNNDGYLDLYVVNGMIDQDLFKYLPKGELVEQNQVFVNEQNGTFMPAPEYKLDSKASGRGMSMADLNNDGALDIVVNNLASPAMLFENGLCNGKSLQVELRWPNSMNSNAIGAKLLLHTSSGTLLRDIRSGSGYISGDPARAHFGFDAGSSLTQLEVRWPDGQVTRIDNPTPNSILKVTR